MATYIVDTTSTNNLIVRVRFISGQDDRIRSFMKFDLTSSGLTVAEITSVTLKTYCNTFVGVGFYYQLQSDSDSGSGGWGATLDASEADFTSTNVNDEMTQIISTTGWVNWTVNKNSLDLNGVNYFRIRVTNENTGTNNQAIFYPQDWSTSSQRPVLCIATDEPPVAATGVKDVLGPVGVVPYQR